MALSKSDVTLLKGVSILIMVFLHTFLRKSDVELCTSCIYILGEPLVSHLDIYAGICVSLYLFLGGYGLYLRRLQSPLNNGRRILLLFINYWIVLLCFVFLGSIIAPNIYPGSFNKFFFNFFALSYSYNDTWWFLAPYVLLIVSSNILFRFVERYSGWIVFGISYLICILTSYVISRFGDQFLYGHIYYIPFLWFHLLNGFLTGAIFARYDLFDKIKVFIATKGLDNNYFWFFILLISLVLKICARTSVINIFAVVILFICLISMSRNKRIDSILSALGKESTNMWYIHAFFCFYLFHDFVYSLKFPLVVFLFMILASYISARIISLIYSPCRDYIIHKYK